MAVSYTHLDVYKRQQWHAAMVEQIIIIYLIQTALCQKEFHMLLQFITVRESPLKPFHDICFLVGKGIWTVSYTHLSLPVSFNDF